MSSHPPYSPPIPWEDPGGRPVGELPPVVQAPRHAKDRIWLHVLLLVATVVTTTALGMLHYASFLVDFVPRPLVFTSWFDLLLGGFSYSFAIMAILGSHEMGHYLACRYYGVDATLPFFLPMPIVLTGTLGAFIRIRSHIPTKAQLFDIGVAGPIAGFVVAVPLLFLGVAMSRVVPLPPNFEGHELGEPLLFQWASQLIWGDIPDGMSMNLHPIAFAAWFGLLATVLNLFPFGQLDGGHVSYALLGRRSSVVSLITTLAVIALAWFSSISWAMWALVMVTMLFTLGPHHPPTLDEDLPLDRNRQLVALFCAFIFIVCFTPAPIEPYQIIPAR